LEQVEMEQLVVPLMVLILYLVLQHLSQPKVEELVVEKIVVVTQLLLAALEVEAVMTAQLNLAVLLLLIMVVREQDSLVERVTTPQVVAVEELVPLVEKEVRQEWVHVYYH
tara:strand:+ start:218 stop:550 length:333 start_codon:yes stop_codon:yes gene_type:complete